MALRFIDQEPALPVQLPDVQPASTDALEQDMGDQAGLKPLPLNRMFQQAGRPMTRHRSKPNKSLQDLTIQRNQRNQQTIENWNPLEAENKQRLNNTNPNPRSKPSAPSDSTTHQFLIELSNTAEFRKRKAFNDANRDDPMWSKNPKEFTELYGQELNAQNKTDASLFLTSQEKAAVKSMVFDYLDSTAGNKSKVDKDALPLGLNSRFPKLGNDLLYEWKARRMKMRRENTLDMLEISRDTIRGI